LNLDLLIIHAISWKTKASKLMKGYDIKIEEISIGGYDYKIRSLKDRQQFTDEEDIAEYQRISSANWSHFGVVWPSGLVLAQLISTLPLQGLRILELGCGLGIASLVASRRGGDITASDHHPLAESFMSQNVTLNDLPCIKFAHGDWCTPITQLGKFSLIIGSDLLYERDQSALLSVFIDCHATSDAKIIICDPGRREAKRFNRLMIECGFSAFTEYFPAQMLMGQSYTGRVMTYERGVQ
jgi:predicted nicotinamide N-methyase